MIIEELWQLLVPILILAGFVTAGYVLRFVLSVYITKLTRKTKTKIDDIILNAIKVPIVAIFLIVGIILRWRKRRSPQRWSCNTSLPSPTY